MSKLIVFEGPDHVGKTTISMAAERILRVRGHRCERLSFPGHDSNSLGALIRELHHASSHWMHVHPAAMQLVHVAAHVDLIERRIRPMLADGIAILLDRFWWSTAIYATLDRVPAAQVKAMLETEAVSWRQIRPALLFLVERDSPSVDPDTTAAYEAFSRDVETSRDVRRLNNSGELADAVAEAVDGIETVLGPMGKPYRRLPENERDVQTQRLPFLFSRRSPAKPSPVYDTYWRFAAERQEMFFRRLFGEGTVLTCDPILRKYKFTNAYRASDRVSQYLIRHVIYEGEQTCEEIFFRTLLFKLFNRISTWRLLEARLEQVSWRSYSFRRYDTVMSEAIAAGERIYSGAYIMPAARGFGEVTRKHRTHLHLLEQMMRDDAPARCVNERDMQGAFRVLRQYAMMGDFLAYQFVTDLNYSSLTDFSETEFVAPGPGALDGIRKCFEDCGGLSNADVVRLVADRQDVEFERLGLSFRSLWGRRLQLMDCQNLFCETDKYARVAHPEIRGLSRRTKIKQLYRPTRERLEYWYPPKWGINGVVAATVAQRGEPGE
ncbi:MAG: putative DNA base hypermodification protein [Chloroflexi bacterium]|nr:putative DNA base hypermodification protein [Chloroflexota bacterium]